MIEKKINCIEPVYSDCVIVQEQDSITLKSKLESLEEQIKELQNLSSNDPEITLQSSSCINNCFDIIPKLSFSSSEGKLYINQTDLSIETNYNLVSFVVSIFEEGKVPQVYNLINGQDLIYTINNYPLTLEVSILISKDGEVNKFSNYFHLDSCKDLEKEIELECNVSNNKITGNLSEILHRLFEEICLLKNKI